MNETLAPETLIGDEDQGRRPRKGLRVLWLKTELLHPVDKGGKIRTYEMLKRLKRSHHITYVALDDGTATRQERDAAREYCHELVNIPFSLAPRRSRRFYFELAKNAGSRLPYAISRYQSAALQRLVRERVASGGYDVLVADFLVQAINVPAGLPIATVLFQHNVEAMIWQRHAQNQSNGLSRRYFEAQWQRMSVFEREACQRFDAVVAVSTDDCDTMRRDYGIEHVAAVPTGVDTDFFRPSGREPAIPHSLVFTGSMDWMPNDDAIRYFLDEAWPLIRQQVPDATLTVVGRNPGPGLIERAAKQTGVTVTGRVDDVRPFMERARCFIVPIRIGGGTRLKIYEAMAMEKPVVSTTIGAEGLPLRPHVDVLLEDDAAAFAGTVARVLRDDAYAGQIGREAANTVRTKFSWDHVAERFTELLFEACDRSK